MNRFCAEAWVIVVGLVMLPPSASAATFTLNPAADATLSAANPSNNYGSGGAFAISAVGLPKGEFRSLLQFDLASAKASFDASFGAGQWTLAAASLQLTAASPNNALFNSSAAGQIEAMWQANDSWSEGNGTPNAPGATGVIWNALPSLASVGDQSLAVVPFSGGTSGTTIMSLAFAPGFVADILGGSLTTIRLKAPTSETMVSGLFNSRSFGSATSRPLLTLEAVAVPEPQSILLLVAAMVACQFVKRPRSN